MIIQLKKFGTTLTSRDEGKEAFAAFQPSLSVISKAEEVKVDFSGVNTLTPSWADEFITPLVKLFNDRLVLVETNNLSVQATLDLLEVIHKYKFIRSKSG